MMRLLLHRWADPALREENGRLRSALRNAIKIARRCADAREQYRRDAERWRSIATDRAEEIRALKERR